MELRQQVTLSEDNIKELILKDLKRQGIRVREDSIEFKRPGSTAPAFFALTMTEEEILISDMKVITGNMLSTLEIKDRKLKRKLWKRMGDGARIGSLLRHSPQTTSDKDDLLRNNELNPELFDNSGTRMRDKLKASEEKMLIDIFGQLGIRVQKYFKD